MARKQPIVNSETATAERPMTTSSGVIPSNTFTGSDAASKRWLTFWRLVRDAAKELDAHSPPVAPTPEVSGTSSRRTTKAPL